MLKRIIFSILLLSPAAAWALYKPMRVLVPQLVAGISCVTETICLEDVARYAEAKSLYTNALDFVDSSVASIKAPHVLPFAQQRLASRLLASTSQLLVRLVYRA